MFRNCAVLFATIVLVFAPMVRASVDSSSTTIQPSLEFALDHTLPTVGAASLHAFTVENNRYLAVANFENRGSFDVNSEIFQWNPTASRFQSIQTIRTHGARAWKSFRASDSHFLALASRNAGTSIYEWNAEKQRFQNIQMIDTFSAENVDTMQIGSDVFMMVSELSTQPSRIYRWDSATKTFVHYQQLDGYQYAEDGRFFRLGHDVFLAVSFLDKSVVFHWEPVTRKFVVDHKLDSVGTGWSIFSIEDDVFASISGDETVVFRWEDHSDQFVKHQTIATASSARKCHFVTFNSRAYLVVPVFVGQVEVYEWEPRSRQFVLSSKINNSHVPFVESFTAGGRSYLALAVFQSAEQQHQTDSLVYALAQPQASADASEASNDSTLAKTIGVVVQVIIFAGGMGIGLWFARSAKAKAEKLKKQ